MRQALHIFKKDVRYLRVEIALLLALAVTMPWTNLELLVVLAANYAVARLIHAEPIAGQNQFWTTRPYRWKSLLGAKALFILLFVNLPLFLAQCFMVVNQHFSFAESLPGLVWSQVLMVLCLSIPVACLASLTAGMVSFLLAEFTVVAAVFVSQGLLHVRMPWLSFLPGIQEGPDAVGWIRDSLVVIIVTCFGVFILYRQYRTRQTDAGRKWAIGGAAFAAIVSLCVPWPAVLGVQSALSREAFDGSSLKASLESVTRSAFPPRGRDSIALSEVSLPFAVTGIPDGVDAQADALTVALEGGDGRTWDSGILIPNLVEAKPVNGARETVVGGYLRVEPEFFRAESAQPVTVHVRIYFTLFGNARSRTFRVREQAVNAIDGLQCWSGLLDELYCRSIFRWPERRVSARSGEGVETVIRSVSYSPFPATLGLSPIEQHSFATAPPDSPATILTKEPISHFPMEAEIRNVRLTEFTADAKRRAMFVRPPGMRR